MGAITPSNRTSTKNQTVVGVGEDITEGGEGVWLGEAGVPPIAHFSVPALALVLCHQQPIAILLDMPSLIPFMGYLISSQPMRGQGI